MKATKCDRCGKYFEDVIGTISYQNKRSDDYHYELDICPDCLSQFKQFMRTKENSHD